MQFFYESGSLAAEGWDVLVSNKTTGMKHTGTRVGTLSPGTEFIISADKTERLIWPLDGDGILVSYKEPGASDYQTQKLAGRKSVFSGHSDIIYLSIETEIKITGVGRVIIAEAPATNYFPTKLILGTSVPVFSRGAGAASRQVHNFGAPEELLADRFIVVEIIVPAGNWSGSPAHKHDTYIPGVESNLEEIYYFESRVAKGIPTPAQSDPHGFIAGRASDDRHFELLNEVRSGDVALVPHGWHGPSMAMPGYDLYFMNVMAGPDPDRAWNITDDPNEAWIRESWKDQAIDPRLPY